MLELTKDSPIAKFLPATLIPDDWLSDGMLETFAHRMLDTERIRCERTPDGMLRMYPPTPRAIWLMAEKIHTELNRWIVSSNKHGKAMMRRRFFLNNERLMMCPDVAFVSLPSKKKSIDIEAARLLKMCPNFVVEICTRPKELRRMKDKMLQWIASGAELAWLMVPQEECVFVYAPGSEPEIEDGNFIFGDGPTEELFVHLDDVWEFDVYRRRY
jgi:hypothetical protein